MEYPSFDCKPEELAFAIRLNQTADAGPFALKNSMQRRARRPSGVRVLLAAGWPRCRLIFGDARQHDRRPVGEFRDQREIAPHRLDRFSQRR